MRTIRLAFGETGWEDSKGGSLTRPNLTEVKVFIESE